MPASAWKRENTSPLAARSSHFAPELDPFAIPQRPVLLLEQQQAARPVEARPQPGRVEVHEREQREGLRDRAHRVLRQQRRQPDGLVAQLAADRLLGVRGEVALVEEQVEHRVHAGQPGPQRLERRRLEVGRRLAQPVARARQPLVHVRFGGEQPQRDLRGAEAAQRLQRQHQPGFPRNGVVAADEEHPQQVVPDLAGEIRRRRPLAAFDRVVGAARSRIRSRPASRRRSPIRRL